MAKEKGPAKANNSYSSKNVKQLEDEICAKLELKLGDTGTAEDKELDDEDDLEMNLPSEAIEYQNAIKDYVLSRADLSNSEKEMLIAILVTYFTYRRVISIKEVMDMFDVPVIQLAAISKIVVGMQIKQYLTAYINDEDHLYLGVLPNKIIVHTITGYSQVDKKTNPLDIIVEISTAVFGGLISQKEFESYSKEAIDTLMTDHPALYTLFISLETSTEQLMLSLALKYALYNNGLVSITDFAYDIFRNADEASEVINNILEKKYRSYIDGIFFVEEDKDGNKCFKLAGKYIVSAFGEGFSNKNANNNDGLQEDESLTEQVLFFNEDLSKKVNIIHDALEDVKYNEIVTTLKDLNMASGIAILLSGGPGTGKTALAKELAYRSGRSLFYVNVSAVRGKYVGESEKNTQKIFEDYRRAKQRLTKTPILLFNEADALLGTRIEGVTNSADQMSNTMQNILLEEFERFNGILIATTNLAANLDPAFDRRFLFKLDFAMPDKASRYKIWLSKLPHFDRKILDKLSETAFAGGEITSIVKQFVIAEAVGAFKSHEDIFSLITSAKKGEPVMGFLRN